jgi:hypothetical protein
VVELNTHGTATRWSATTQPRKQLWWWALPASPAPCRFATVDARQMLPAAPPKHSRRRGPANPPAPRITCSAQKNFCCQQTLPNAYPTWVCMARTDQGSRCVRGQVTPALSQAPPVPETQEILPTRGSRAVIQHMCVPVSSTGVPGMHMFHPLSPPYPPLDPSPLTWHGPCATPPGRGAAGRR